MKNQIIDKRIEFIDFYKQLCTFLDERGILKDFKIEHCVIVNIPKNYAVFESYKTTKIFGIKFSESSGRFCGFMCDNSFIIENNFIVEGYTEDGELKNI